MAGIIEARFRESKSFCEQIGHRSFVIIPHEICVKKATANMMITYYEFHYCKQLAKLQFASYIFTNLSLSAFVTTDTELQLIAAAAIMGLRRRPK